MKKKIATMLLVGITAGILPADEELTVTMEITSEMPLLQGEEFSGKIRLTNNGTDAIKLVKNKDDFWFVSSQVRFFIDLPIKEQELAFGYPLRGVPYGNRSRADIKEETDSFIEGDFTILPAGQSCEFTFDGIDFERVQFLSTRERLPCKAELYVQPDRWIPITVTPPLELAKDATFNRVTPHAVSQAQAKSVYVTRVSIGTNEFLRAGGKRILDLSPDDEVEQKDSSLVTVTRKDGTKTEIATDKIDIFAKQREEKRKAKPATGD